MPSKKKKYNARFPAGRIKKIMQTDEEVGKVAQAVPVVISRTLELFVESLLTKSLDVTLKRNAKTLSPSHLKQCILSESRFDFLKDLVKNIPDISHAEERESGQTWSAESSPNANRYPESASSALVNPGPSNVLRKTRQPQKRDNGQSSDSGSDHELPAKLAARNTFGNGRNPPRPSANFDEELKAFKQKMNQTKKINPPPSNSNFAIPAPMTPTMSSVPAPVAVAVPTIVPSTRESNNNSQRRLFNFYTETLPDEEDDKEKSMHRISHSSVIQPNPEYSAQKSGQNSFGYYKPAAAATASSNPDNQIPYAKISIDGDSRGNSEPSVPKLHIDLTGAGGIASESKLHGEPFTPTLLLQPRTPSLADPNLGGILSKFLSRQRSATEQPTSSTNSNNSAADRPSFNLDASTSTLKKHHSNEPPLLLPINLIHKAAAPLKRKSSTVDMDEDYDT
ncbi:negative cofactor 2 alpha [Arctopsyche grandis]|uniref:negative cofactor 2 alpha n=1 Tax=Arctopsyche grandis TaxID=121162 RepID=UPI00406D71B9